MNNRWHRLWQRLRFQPRRAQLDAELAEELEFHRALTEKDHREAGHTPADAAALARRQMGNVTQAREESREAWSFPVERLLQDLRYALRVSLRNPGFTAVAAFSLALGIGGSAAVFSFVNALLLRPLPYAEPSRLVRIEGFYPPAAFVVFQQQSHAMDVAAVNPGAEFNLTGRGEAVRLFGSPVSVNLFDVLGVSPLLGRTFHPGEERPANDAVVILSHALWSDRFGADPGILGSSITLNDMDRQVVGVMPPGFDYPSAKVQFWVPARINPAVMGEYWGGPFTPLIGRLRPGRTLAEAQSEVPALVSRIFAMFPFPMPSDWNQGATAIPLQDDLVTGVRTKLLLLFSSVGMVLLIACANVAALLLSRAAVRRKEIALRVALGAGRLRIIRQLLTESIVLSLFGGGLGILFGLAAFSVFQAVLPADTPGLAGVAMDFQVLAFAAGLAVLTGIAFGLAPALSATQVDLTEPIKTGSQRTTAQGWNRLRSWLIGGEIALTVVLLVAAGLLIKTLYSLTRVDPGFRSEQILTIRITPNQSLCAQPTRCIALYDDLLQRAREISGVSAAALASTLPMDGRYELAAIPVDVEDHAKSSEFPAPMFWAGAITPDYLSMMHISLLAGRNFTAADTADSARVLLITAATARRFWPGQNPIGKHIKAAFDREWRTVIGVVDDVRQYALTGESPDWIPGAIYLPYPQAVVVDYAMGDGSVENNRRLPAAMHLMVKTAADPSRIGTEIRNLAAARNPNVPISDVQAMEAVVASSIDNRRSTMGVFVSFAAAALLLAAVGVYGLVSYSVSQRTYEIGVRMAIGASKGSILAMVMGQSLRIALAGIAVGAVAALALTRFLASQLYGVAATDPATFLAVSALLLVTAAAASCAPAWRAAQTNLTKSLRVN